MFKAGIIGVSGFGNVHYQDLLDYAGRGKLEIAAATVINQIEEKEKCEKLRNMGCAVFADFREMLDSFSGKLDVCFIPTGIGMHAPMAIAAMRNGANCMIEKPAAPTVQDVEAMREMERKSGRFVAVGFQAIYLPEILKLKKDLSSGVIGGVERIKVVGLWPRDSQYYNRNGWAGKLKDSNGNWVLDSPFNNALAHYLNLACFLAGSNTTESARLKTAQASLFRCNPEIENADSAAIRLTTIDGPEILFYATHCSKKTFGPVIRIEGSKGFAETDMTSITMNIDDGNTETTEIDNSRWRSNLMDAVLARIGDPDALICGLDIAGTHTLAVNGAHDSSPIIEAAPEDVERESMDDGTYRFICRGLDEKLLDLFAEGAMPDSSIYAWLATGKIVDLEEYKKFQGS